MTRPVAPLPVTRGPLGALGWGLLAVLLATAVLTFSRLSPYFLTADNLLSLLDTLAVAGILAVPATFLIRAGQVDLSSGAVAALAGVLLASLAPEWGIGGAVVAVVVGGMLVGAVNGLLVAGLGVNSLAATFAGMSLLRGIAYLLPGGLAVTLPGFSALGTAEPVWSIPVPVLIFLGLTVAGVALQVATPLPQLLSPLPVPPRRRGRRSTALAPDHPLDPPLVTPSGLAPTERARRGHRWALVGSFVLSGSAAALVGMILASQLGTGLPAAGTGLEVTVVTAVLLGGGSLSGGRGTVAGTVLALLLLSMLDNGLALVNISSYAQQVLHGALLVVALVADRGHAVWLSRRAAARERSRVTAETPADEPSPTDQPGSRAGITR